VESLDPDGVRRWLGLATDRILERTGELTGLDAAIGDGDHGTNLARGLTAVRERVLVGAAATPGEVLRQAGMTLLSTVGGAAGPLYGTFFLRAGASAGAAPALDARAAGEALEAGVAGVRQRGRAEPGDKTMLDALLPAAEAYRAAEGQGLAAAAAAAASAGEAGARATVPLVAHKGRASYLGERSAGHQDPGATSASILLRALADTAGAPA
jgi:phosphoenolpyruvate---glycerone phosphotransferase subunit DhaL